MRRNSVATRSGLNARALPLLCLLAAACAGEVATEPDPEAFGPIDVSCPGEPLSPSPLRRLTRFEYANVVEDVFGLSLGVEDVLPRDEVALGFDDQAGTLSLTDLHVEGYTSAGNRVGAFLAEDPARYQALAGCSSETIDCARALVTSLSRRLERRPPSAARIDALLELFGSDLSPAAFQDGVSRVVEALLQGPELLYRFERSAADPEARGARDGLASPWVLASRLAFLLWGSAPDEALLDAAEAGRLASAADVEREARRLLADSRARRGVLHFYLQWLELSDFDEVEKDQRLFGIWDESLRSSLRRETTRFLEAVLWEDDARLGTLLAAPYSFVNAVLQDFYGLPVVDPDADELVRVGFGAGVPRAGILTHGAILSVQAKANQTDPVHRGKFIRERFFCTTPPPPPPDLVVSPPLLDPRKTTRQRFEQHRSEAACAGCHALLDPVGFAFEHYDATGRYRETEAGLPIDASGELVGTDVDGPLGGVPDLAEKLIESGQVRRCVATQWFRYAFGRGETADDACTLDKLAEVLESSRGDLAELLVAITQTDPFLRPAPEPEAEAEAP